MGIRPAPASRHARSVSVGAALSVLFWACAVLDEEKPAPDEKLSMPASGIEITPLQVLFVLANVEFVLLHEFAHVLLIDYDVPILGGEEDAADTVAILTMIAHERTKSSENEVWRKALVATTIGWHMLWKREGAEIPAAALHSRHSLSGQRFFNIACLIYGSDPQRFASWPSRAQLPPERAEWCEDEYRLARRSLDRIVKGDLIPPGRPAGAPPPPIAVVYEEPGSELSAELIRRLREIEMIDKTAAWIRENLKLKAPMEVRILSCEGPAAVWVADTRQLLMCYELLELYYELAVEIPEQFLVRDRKLRDELMF